MTRKSIVNVVHAFSHAVGVVALCVLKQQAFRVIFNGIKIIVYYQKGEKRRGAFSEMVDVVSHRNIFSGHMR